MQTHLEDIHQKLIEERQAIQAEEQRATAEESLIKASIVAETNRATVAEGLLQTQLNSLGIGNRAYLTYDIMIADQANIPAKSKITVTNDPTSSKNGDYQFDGTSFTKSGYDILVQAKAYTDAELLKNQPSARTISLTEGVETTINATQANDEILYFTGTLTENTTVYFPKQRGLYVVQNLTSGGFSIHFKTLEQSEVGISVKAGATELIFNTSASIRRAYGHKLDATGGHAKEVTADTLAWTDTSQKLANAAFVHNVSKGRAGYYNVDLNNIELPFTIPTEALNYSTIRFTGALTTDVKVTMPSSNANWTLMNITSGGKTVTVTNTIDTSPIDLYPGQTAQINQTSAYLTYIGLPSRNGYLRGSYEADSPPTADNSNRVATAAHVNAKIDYKDGIKTITLTDEYLNIPTTEMDRAIISLSGTLSDVSTVILGSSAKFHLVVNNTNKVLNIKGPQQPTAFELRVGTRTFVMCSGGYVHQTSSKVLPNEHLIVPTTDSPPTVDNSTRLATTAHVKAWNNYLDSIRTVTLTAEKTDLTPSELDRENIVFNGDLPEAKVLKLTGKRYIRNSTNVKINVLGSNQNGTGLELPVGAVAYVLFNGTYISIISNSANTGSSGGLTSIPQASSTVLGGVKVGSGLTINPNGVLSATPQSAISLMHVGKFKEGSNYLAGQLVEHGSGLYEVKANVNGAITPYNNPNFNKISHNNYAGPDRTLTTLSHTQTNEISASNLPYMMTKDGLVCLNKETRYLKVSLDYGLTWEAGSIFDAGASSGIRWIKQTEDNELLVCTYTVVTDQATITRVWKSTGWTGSSTAPTSWTKVFEFQKKGINLSDWGFSQHGKFVIMTEYGYKNGVDAVQDAETYARYCYLSKDYGKTWTTIFDLGSVTDGIGVHMHGACFDPYWNRIWVSHGDGFYGSNGLLYSDDLGKTWTSATQYHNQGANFSQSVHIIALPTCILLASDSHPNGIQRIDRAQGKVPYKGYYTVESAYMIPDQLERLNHLFHHTAKAQWLPDSPYMFVWGCETNPGKSGVVATFDGWTFHEVWVSEINNSTGYGGRTVLGVTPENEVIIGCNDPAISSSWYQVRAKVAID